MGKHASRHSEPYAVQSTSEGWAIIDTRSGHNVDHAPTLDEAIAVAGECNTHAARLEAQS